MENMLFALIPLAPFALGGLFIWTRHQSRMLEHQSKIAAEKAAQYAVGRADLEARVRVLETIVTDGGIVTSAQIEALRERPGIGSGDKVQ